MKFLPLLFTIVAFTHAFAPRSTVVSHRPGTSLHVADDAKVVLITGGSQGLGQAMAYDIAKDGQKLVINYIDFPGMKEQADETCEEIKKLGGDAIAVAGDVSKPEDCADMMKAAFEHYGQVDVLINNAGITKDNLMLRMKPEQWAAVLAVNLSGVFFCSQAYFKTAIKKKQPGGRVINIASVSGMLGNPGQANYSSTKGGVISLTRTCAREFAYKNFKCNAICPGFIETAMTAKIDPAILEKTKEMIPLKRLGKPSEIAAMAKFLALNEGADYITGHCFVVDGGVATGCT
uniref:3-oxoacyl-[acyl-carrier-protein] reductase n=1 Tax=Amphora coffeiformis TaxID=265554 RepID=A0A7S3P968_9STRA|mmetsp:Transcript_1527/g.3400  ORF Transcript_1527/g.3400 Transcript_1527/m.3400 type:complete len:290 (+) Transcript_1527:180-1049(+)